MIRSKFALYIFYKKNFLYAFDTLRETGKLLQKRKIHLITKKVENIFAIFTPKDGNFKKLNK